MTNLLEQAFAAASRLPESDQDAIATWLLEELASERRWQSASDRSQSQLARLVDEALAEHHAGETQELDLDDL